MHLGASDDAIGSEDARLVFTHIFQRLIDQEIATEALRQPSARARIATAVGGPRQRARKCSSRIVMMRTPDSANHSKSLGQDYLTWKSSHFDEMFRKVSALARLCGNVLIALEHWQLTMTPKDTVGGILFRNSTPSGIIMQHAIV
jgi:hypothetical protein